MNVLKMLLMNLFLNQDCLYLVSARCFFLSKDNFYNMIIIIIPYSLLGFLKSIKQKFV